MLNNMAIEFVKEIECLNQTFNIEFSEAYNLSVTNSNSEFSHLYNEICKKYDMKLVYTDFWDIGEKHLEVFNTSTRKYHLNVL